MDNQAASAVLTDERAKLVRQLAELGANESGDLTGETDYGDGFADAAAATAERTEVIGLVETLHERLGDVDHALERIAEGTYGRCESCGREIDTDRMGVPTDVTLLRRVQAPAKLTDRSPSAARFPVGHLASRFFAVLTARGPDPAAQDEIAALLDEQERELFSAQSFADQEHAHQTMLRAAGSTDDRTVLRAALLHDVGKAGNRLGAIGRSLATVLDAVGLPLWKEARAYRRHGAIGAERLTTLGVEPLVVDFAARHPDPDPGPHDPAVWRILLAADHV